MNTPYSLIILLIGSLLSACNPNAGISSEPEADWSIAILPASVRLDPASNMIIDDRFSATTGTPVRQENLLTGNWVFDGEQASLQAARGEYISFQVVVTSHTQVPIKYIDLEISNFSNSQLQFSNGPEIFLEWSVEVKTPSTGYPTASLGSGWYPDALIPLNEIQKDSSQVEGRLVYPLELPDFNNRIDRQKSLVFWVDQYVPFQTSEAPAGTYQAEVKVMVGSKVKTIPIALEVWDFAIPNENKLKASLQHEGFLSGKSPDEELEIYQLFKRNRISLMDPTYKPVMNPSPDGEPVIEWESFDARLEKYFDGSAFTSANGYHYGPGYGEPVETFILPFNVRGKHGNRGWPDIGSPKAERDPDGRSYYIKTIQALREHLEKTINPEKTEITVYLNGLDESYFPQAWDRMVYYGDMFEEYYPEAHFRIDGGYSEEAMAVVKNSINSWASHTINYDIENIRKYQEMGIEDWLYGPMLYESRVNSWVGSSTFIDLPLVNDRAISWSCWKYHTYSWISWGIGAGWKRAWYDPETWKDTYKGGADSDPDYYFKKLNGNGLLVYSPGIVPNVNSVCASIRLKSMRDGVQEYEYLRLLSELDNSSSRADSIVNQIIKEPFGSNAIGNLDVWDFDAKKWDEARIALGNLISGHSGNH